jgi:outer membrane protein
MTMRKMMLFAAAVSLFMTLGFSVYKANAASVTPPELVVPEEPTTKDISWKVGLGAAVIPDYEGSKDYKTAPVPLVSAVMKDGMSVELLGATLRANIVPSHTWSFGPELRYRGERNDVANSTVNKMGSIKGATEAGVYAGYEFDNWSIKIDVTHDISGVYNGTIGGLSVGYNWLLKPWRFTLTGSATVADNNYMNTYFGVNARQSAASGLPTFTATGGTKDVGLTFLAGYRIDEHWGAIGAVRYSKLLGDASDSPLVDNQGDSNQYLLGVLVSYSF